MADTEQVVGLNNDFEKLLEEDTILGCKIKAIAELPYFRAIYRNVFWDQEQIKNQELVDATADTLASLRTLKTEPSVEEWTINRIEDWKKFATKRNTTVDENHLRALAENDVYYLERKGSLEELIDSGLSELGVPNACGGPAQRI